MWGRTPAFSSHRAELDGKRVRQIKRGFWIFILVLLLPVTGFSQTQVTVSHFMVFDWFKSVKLSWRASAGEGADAIFEIYRSDELNGPYVLVQDIKLGDKKFIDIISNTYYFIDKKVEVGRRYYYKMALRGTGQVFGPLDGLACKAPPGT
jgi:hypothetical protein